MPNDAIDTTATSAEDAIGNLSQAEYETYRRTGEQPKQDPPADKPAEGTKPSETGDEPDETDPDSETGKDSQDPEGKPKGKGGFQKKITKLTEIRRNLEAENEALRRQLAGKDPAAKPADQPAAEEPAGKPKVEDFEDYDKFVEALADWKVEQREAKREQQEREKAQQAEARQRAQTWETRQEAARGKFDDYDEALESIEIPRTPALPTIQAALMESEIGPEIAYHLAKHPEEVKRIAALSPVKAAAEIGKLEAKLTTPPPENRKPASQAPPPIAPVRSGASRATEPRLDDENISIADYEKIRRRQGYR